MDGKEEKKKRRHDRGHDTDECAKMGGVAMVNGANNECCCAVIIGTGVFMVVVQ